MKIYLRLAIALTLVYVYTLTVSEVKAASRPTAADNAPAPSKSPEINTTHEVDDQAKATDDNVSFSAADVAREAGDIIKEEGDTTEDPQQFSGSFFDVQVPIQNYYFAKSVVAVFGNKFGKQPTTPEEEDAAAWDQLLLSFIAFQQKIEATQEEADSEVDKILRASRVEFDRKIDRPGYEKWVKEKTNESVELFENQIKHLMQLQKLKDQIIKSIVPVVTDEEAFEAFLNENSSVDIELVKFDTEKKAVDFYDKVKASPRKWDKEKSKRPKDFKMPGGVTLQFLIDFWNIPAPALQEMAKMKAGELHKPSAMYKGWGVYKVMGATAADEAKFKEAKERYVEKVKAGKRYEGYNAWFEKLKKDANIKVNPQPHPVAVENMQNVMVPAPSGRDANVSNKKNK